MAIVVALLVALGIVGVIVAQFRATALARLEQARDHELDRQRLIVRERVESAIEFIRQADRWGGPASQAEMLERLKEINFGRRADDYLFIVAVNDLEGGRDFGRLLLSRNTIYELGSTLSDDFPDARGTPFMRDVLTQLREAGEAFVRYHLNKPSLGAPAEKISYFRYFENWRWVVGTGVYLDELSGTYQAEVARIEGETRQAVRFLVIGFGLLVVVAGFTILIVARLQAETLEERMSIARDVLDAEDILLVLVRGPLMTWCNRPMLEFLGYPTFDALRADHASMAEFFLPGEDVLPAGTATWLLEADKWRNEGREPRVVMFDHGRREQRTLSLRVGRRPVADSARVVAFIDVSDAERGRAALREKSRQLAESNAELEQFAYVASHDLQEPLRMVSGYLELIERRMAGQLEGELGQYFGFALDGAGRMRRMIADLLDYSRITTRGKPPVRVPVADVCAAALANLGSAIAEAGAQVEVGELPEVLGDRGQLMRLFQNLIGNAVKYRRPDRPPRVTVTAFRRGGEEVFAIADNGIGIAEKYHERVFGIFQRLHGSGSYQGSGIGLAVCKRIVERHGGRIWLESEEGEGSTFRFTLPAATFAPEVPPGDAI